MTWWPDTELRINQVDIEKLNEEVVQFKNPIIALYTQAAAPLLMRRVELNLRSNFPWISHFVISQAVRVAGSLPSKLMRLDKAFGHVNYRDDGLLDARRHVAWAALLSRYIGVSPDLCFLALHEIDNEVLGNDDFFVDRSKYYRNSATMDFLNNAIGISIGRDFAGTDDEMLNLIEDSLYSGQYVVMNHEYDLVSSTYLVKRATANINSFRKKNPILGYLKHLRSLAN